MAKATFVQDGNNVDYTPLAAVAAGDVVVQGAMVGVAKTPIGAGLLGALATGGTFDIAKAAIAIDAGAGVYWDADGDPVGGTAGSGAATTTSAGNTFLGWAVTAAADSASAVRTRLFGAPAITVNHYGPLNNTVADPGNAGAIPVTASGCVAIVTTGAQTRTLAAPGFAGQELVLAMKTDGGDCVITCATGVNQTGNNTITMNDAGDTIRLVGIEVGANKRWRVVVNDGCVLTTV
jgi:predicted RecA/RadA family phage recombinase